MSHALETPFASVAEIAQFYDDFGKRLIRDYVHGNARVAAAVDRVCSLISTSHVKVLDVGCGIGSLANCYKARCPWVSVHGVDISPANISIAKRLFERPDVAFSVSAMEHPPEHELFDIVALIDVYEHIPRAKWPNFNQVLAESLSPNGALVLTIPSPLHQAYLAEHNPQGLQIVDETVTLSDIMALQDQVRGTLTCYAFVDIWHTNDYIHVIIDRSPEFRIKQRFSDQKTSLWRKLRGRLFDEAQADVQRRRSHVRMTLGLDVD
jgi:trans-aconitate methyltransferase